MPKELDYMEYPTNALAQAAYVSNGEPSSWDLFNEDCADFTGWTDGDGGDAVSSINPAGQFQFDSGSVGVANYATEGIDFGSTPNTFTVNVELYHDALGTRGATEGNDDFQIDVRQADEIFRAIFGTDGLFLRDTGSGYTEVGTDLVKSNASAEWQEWRFLVTFGTVGDGVCNVYLKDSTYPAWSKVGTAIPCSYVAGVTDGYTRFIQYGTSTAHRITHVEYYQIATGLYPPTLQSYSEPTIKTQGSYSLKGVAAITDSLNKTLTRTIS